MERICKSASIVLRERLLEMMENREPAFDKKHSDFLEHCVEELSRHHRYEDMVEKMAESSPGKFSRFLHVKEVPTDVEYVCALYEGVHNVIKSYDVPVYLYVFLGQNFYELGKRPSYEVEESVIIGLELYKKNPKMLLCWDDKTCCRKID